MEQKLLHKLFSGKATDGEVSRIRRWVNESGTNRERFFRERALFDAIQLNDAISAKRTFRRQPINLLRWIGSVAAAAVVALLVLYRPDGFRPSGEPEQSALNTIKVPAGQQAELILSDGTHVWLNTRSELSYPTAFDTERREVNLKGEAFFDVAKDAHKKFVVNAGRCAVEVIGTRFNVEAYDERTFSAALLRGSVKVTDKSRPGEPVVLTPDNAVSLHEGRLTVTPITDYDLYRWREGLIIFKELRFKELMEKLERCYGIRIVVDNPHLDDYVCSGKLRVSDGIDTILHALQQDARFTFERDNETIIHIR